MEQFNVTLDSTVPGSKYHDAGGNAGPGTWWGYNQPKIAEFGGDVFMLVQENHEEQSRSVLYVKRNGRHHWERGFSVESIRPGCIMVDQRFLHVVVVAPHGGNNGRGSLEYYYCLDPENIESFSGQNTLIASDPSKSTVNIRIGAAMDRASELMAVTWGLANQGDGNGHTMNLIYKQRKGERSGRIILGKHLNHDPYYPYTILKSNNDRSYIGVRVMAVQDDPMEDGDGNYYQKFLWAKDNAGNRDAWWMHGLSDHRLARVRPRMMLVDDIWLDDENQIHQIYKEFTVEGISNRGVHYHLIQGNDGERATRHDLTSKEIKFLRLFKARGKLWFLASSETELFITDIDFLEWQHIPTPAGLMGIYPYVAAPRTGTNLSERVDVLLLSGDRQAYPNAVNCHLVIR